CAAHLNRLGGSAVSLVGGMASWMALVVAREVPPPPGLDRLVQMDRIGKGSLGYILIKGGEAIVIDPGRDSGPWLDILGGSPAKPVAVADTHIHADYVSGGSSLARLLGVPYCIHPADSLSPFDGRGGRLDYRPLAEGMSIPLGGSEVRVMHTPGHSPGSVTFMVGMSAGFTGDFMFMDSLGRPDIADRSEEWAADLWRSIARVKSTWPPGILIFPAHYVSAREKNSSHLVCGTLRDVVARNASLRFTDESEFRAWVRASSTSIPSAYRLIKEINLGLSSASIEEMDLLEAGKNECAITGAPPAASQF
ncbi:MAG TPA: MBL fold metallo-hydrolase, partial [Bacteroidota bacterium]|nr:MBL fold metallo-hydrolase [Bacteroidota bacterium]